MIGPFYKTSKGYNGRLLTYQKFTVSYRSGKKPPYVEPLPYQVVEQQVLRVTDAALKYNNDATTAVYYIYGQGGDWVPNKSGVSMAQLHNHVYAKFLTAVREAPAIGVDLAEYRVTLRMLGTALRALRAPLRTYGEFLKREGTVLVRKGKYKAIAEIPMKFMPNAWLTFHFGVEPLVRDIHLLLQYFEKPPKPTVVRAKAQRKVKVTDTVNYGGVSPLLRNMTTTYGVKLQASVIRINDGLATMSDFGLVNPLSIAWEIVPFSFVVDWFYPIGPYIASISDLLGYDVQHPQQVWRSRNQLTEKIVPDRNWPTQYWGQTGVYEAFRMQRSLTPVTMKLQRISIPEKVSAVRGFTAISLLLNALMSSLHKRHAF